MGLEGKNIELEELKTLLFIEPTVALERAEKLFASESTNKSTQFEYGLVILRALYFLGRYQNGIEKAIEIIGVSKSDVTETPKAECLFFKAIFFTGLVEYDKAIEALKEAITIFKRNKRFLRVADCLNVLGCNYIEGEKYRKAYVAFIDCIENAEKFGATIQLIKGRINYSRMFYDLNETEEAIRQLKLIKPLVDKETQLNLKLSLCTNLGTYNIAVGEYDEALIHLETALVLIEKDGYIPSKINIYSQIAFIYFEKNDNKNGAFYAQKGFDLTQELKFFNVHYLASHSVYFQYLNKIGEHQKVIELFEEIEDFTEYSRAYYVLETIEQLAIAYNGVGNVEKALETTFKHISIAKEIEKNKNGLKIFTTKTLNEINSKNLNILNKKEVLGALEKSKQELTDNSIELATEIGRRQAIEEQLTNVNAELAGFVSVASHDMREPLRTISSYAQLLKRQTKRYEDKSIVEFIDFISNASKRMLDLLNDLISYTKAGLHQSNYTQIDLNNILEVVQANLRKQINESGAIITIQNKLPVSLGTKSLFTLVFQNIISNAIKYCKQTPIININYIKNLTHHIIVFTDNGIGVEPQFHDKIFEPFRRLHSKAEYEGSGIGLATVKRILNDRLSGDITMQSEVGKGSEFKIKLPV